jgi:holin-like protein
MHAQTAVAATIAAPAAPVRPYAIFTRVKNALTVAAQVAALALVNKVGHTVVQALRVPMPGNLVGMVLLLILLCTRAVRLEWIQAGATLLVRHLAFFFIPITVGLVAFSGLFREHGLAIFGALSVSAAVGMCASGWTSQALSRRREIA